jgi:hypothetical protein
MLQRNECLLWVWKKKQKRERKKFIILVSEQDSGAEPPYGLPPKPHIFPIKKKLKIKILPLSFLFF